MSIIGHQIRQAKHIAGRSVAANSTTSKDLRRQAATCLEVCCKAAQMK